MKRRSLSRLARQRIFDRAKGCCHLCEQPIGAKPWEADHIKPLWLSGEDGESYMAPAHVECHLAKSVGDQPVKAKTDRIRQKHIGVKKRSTFRGHRKFDGTIVYAKDRQ